MNTALRSAVKELAKKVAAKEEELATMKRMVNMSTSSSHPKGLT